MSLTREQIDELDPDDIGDALDLLEKLPRRSYPDPRTNVPEKIGRKNPNRMMS